MRWWLMQEASSAATGREQQGWPPLCVWQWHHSNPTIWHGGRAIERHAATHGKPHRDISFRTALGRKDVSGGHWNDKT